MPRYLPTFPLCHLVDNTRIEDPEPRETVIIIYIMARPDREFALPDWMSITGQPLNLGLEAGYQGSSNPHSNLNSRRNLMRN